MLDLLPNREQFDPRQSLNGQDSASPMEFSCFFLRFHFSIFITIDESHEF